MFSNVTIEPSPSVLSNNSSPYLASTYHSTSTEIPSQSTPYLQSYNIPQDVALGLLLSSFVVLALAGNILVCVAVISDRHLRKKSNVFIVSLAVADALLALLVMSFAVLNDLKGHWILGSRFCTIWISFDVMFCTASILNLCAISLDRYIHIKSPLHYESYMSTKRTIMFLATIWIMSALISFVPIQLEWHKFGSHIEEVDTTVTYHNQTSANISYAPSPRQLLVNTPPQCVLSLNPIYAVVSSLISFYLPCVVMICIYLRLYRYAMKHARTIKRTMTTSFKHVSSNNITNLAANGNSKFGNDRRISAASCADTRLYTTPNIRPLYYRASDHKAAITLGAIMGTFLFCWTPFFTINIAGSFCESCVPPAAFSVFTWLGYFNSTLNPIIYSIFNKEFRHAFRRVLSLIFPWFSNEMARRRERLHLSYAAGEASMSINTTLYYGGPMAGAKTGVMTRPQGSDSCDSRAASPCYAENKIMFPVGTAPTAEDNTSL